MSQLKLYLLGPPQITVDNQPITDLASRKAQALLFYLVVTRQTHSRQALAGLLWGDMPEEKARRNLRVALTKLRAMLGEFLIIHRRTLAFNLEADYWLDVMVFEAQLQAVAPTASQLQEAVRLYRGHFLDDFQLRDAPLFEEWARPYQERLRQMAMDALYRLAVHQTQQRQHGAGIDSLSRLLTLEPWMEEAHRQMMLLLALSGQRSAALAQYEACRAVLDEELGVEPAEATTELYEQILNEEIEEALAATAVMPTPEPVPWQPPFQAPARLRHFVGRQLFLDEIGAQLTAPGGETRQALVGMGGVGKSTLAAQIAHTVQTHFADGVLWATVATSEPMAILESWAQVYGYDFSRIADLQSMAAAFRGVLADKRVLVVLDDVTSVARVRPLLPGGEHCRVLLTTRDQDLARALNARVWLLTELSPENGRLLLARILGEARVDAETDAADEICNLLQNLPLAVEITAQRLKSRPRRRLADMAKRLRDEKHRLSELKISDHEVRTSFAVSWEILDADLQRVFALLGLFGGRPFTAVALAHIAELDRYLTEDRLFALTALSLVSEEGQSYYRQHPLLADFAREKLEDDGEIVGRFAGYYLQFAQAHQHDYDALHPEWDNLMAAMQTAYERQFWQLVIDFAAALHDAWFTRGRFTQARQAYKWTIEGVQDDADKRATILLQLGRACIKQGDYEEAKAALFQSLEIFSELNEPSSMADVKYELAEIATEQADFETARRLLNECLAIRENVPDGELGIAAVLYKLADIAYEQGQQDDAYEEAETLCQQALEIRQAHHDKTGAVQAIRLLASIATTLRDYALAEEYSLQALQLSQEIGDKHALALTLYGLALIHYYSHLVRKTDSLSLAQEYAGDSLQLQRTMGDQRSQAQLHWLISRIDFSRGDYDAAVAGGQRGIELCDRVGDQWGKIFVQTHLGHVYQAMGEKKGACHVWQAAYVLAEPLKHPLTDELLANLNTLDC